MPEINLTIISGTDRPGSNALKVSGYLDKRYNEAGATAEVVNLQDFPIEQVTGGRYGDSMPEIEQFIKPVLAADGLVFVCPEYNGGYPGILKLFIDYLPFPESLEGKPVCLVGEANGAFGALRAVEQLRQVISYRKGHVFPEQVMIPRINKNFDMETGIKNPDQQELLELQVTGFVEFVKLFKDGTESSV